MKAHAWLVSSLLLAAVLLIGFVPAVSGALYWTTSATIQCNHVGYDFEASATIQLTQNGAVIAGGKGYFYCFGDGSNFVAFRTFVKPNGWLITLNIVDLTTFVIVYTKDGSGTRFPGGVSFTTPIDVCSASIPTDDSTTTYPCSAAVSVQKPIANR